MEQHRIGFLEVGDEPVGPVRLAIDVPGEEAATAPAAVELTYAPEAAPLPAHLPAHNWLRQSWGRELPNLHSLRERLDDEARFKVDRRCRLADLSLGLEESRLALTWPGPQGDLRTWGMTAGAFGQLAARADVPGAVAEWLVAKQPDLGVEAVNRQLGVVLQKEPGREALVRAKSNNGTSFVRAVLSDRYVPLDSDLVVGALDDIFGEQSVEARIGFLSWDGDSLRTVVVFPETFREGAGDGLYMAAVIRNNEVGGGSVEVSPGLLRDVCTNTVIYGWQAGVEAVRQRHIGRIDGQRLRADIAAALTESLKFSDVLADRLEEARRVEVPDVAQVIAFLSRKNRLPRNAAAAWMAGYREESVASEGTANTAFGVVQGLARAARAQRSDARHQTERLAGELLGTARQDLGHEWERNVTRARDLEREEVVQYIGVRA